MNCNTTHYRANSSSVPGDPTKLDTSTLAVEGDFELSSLPQVSQKVLKDGATVYRVRMAVQSFRVSPEVVLNANMTWIAGETRSHLAIPPLTLHTSNTWDGRKELQEGDDSRVPYYWYAGRHLVPLALSSALFLVLCLLALWNYWRNRPQRQVDHALNRVTELLERIGQGTCTREQHLELDGIVRRHFAIGPVPADQLDTKLVGARLVRFLELNTIAIYSDRDLAEEDQARLRGFGHELMQLWHNQKAKS